MKVKKVKFDEQVIKIMAAGGASSKDVEKLQEEYNILYNAFPKVTGEGESITLETAKAPMNIDLKGNGGKNLFDESVETKSAYPTTTIGSVVSYGNSAASTSYVNCCYLEAGETYTFSCNLNTPQSPTHRDSVIVDENNIILEAYKLWNNSTSNTYTPSHSGYLILCVDNNTTETMIEKGSTATDYEPYGASVTGDNTIEVVGKNLLPTTSLTPTYGTATTLIDFGKDKTFDSVTLSFIFNGSYSQVSNVAMFDLRTNDNTHNYLTPATFSLTRDTLYANQQLGTTKTNITFRYLIVYFMTNNYNNFSANSTITNLMLEKGSTATTYEPYQSQSYSINIGAIKLKTGDSIQGSIDNWNIVRLDGTTEAITDATLISQLNNLKNNAESYEGITNILQVNNDKPFIITAKALKDLSNL